ncbi:MAG: hypothetical protein NC177_15140 [Ruminococcus flavefaciens]|nr:hypothetical protein [Ruminococcus flavefaciens]
MILNGYADNAVAGLFKDAKCTYYSEDVIENILKSGDASNIMDTLARCSDDIIPDLNLSKDKKAAIEFISKYSDDGAIIFINCGDNAVKTLLGLTDDLAIKGGNDIVRIVSKFDDAAKAVNFFKVANNQGEEFFKDIYKCSFKDDAVEMIAKYSDNGVKIFNKYKNDNIVGLSKQ